MQRIYRLGRVLYTIKTVGDEVVDGKLAFNTPLNKFWNVSSRLEPPKGRTFPCSPRDELKWTSADLVTARCDTNNTAGTPSPMGTL
mmetsp:Transcript_29832/g.66956  ORF Transcript_29832/g.66956 Transcript_29832/m.66956 type:complete len:86 (+) Transcript_29832:203-460(+)